MDRHSASSKSLEGLAKRNSIGAQSLPHGTFAETTPPTKIGSFTAATKSSKQWQIREPHPTEITELIDVVLRFFNEQRVEGLHNRYFGIDIDTEKVYNWIKVSELDPCRFTRVVIADGKIVGGIAGHISEYVFSKEKLAADQLIYLDPAYSNTRAVFALIDAFVGWAQEQGAREVMLSTSSGFKMDKFGKLVGRKGFKLSAQGYVRRLS